VCNFYAEIYQNTIFYFIVYVAVSATAAAFFGTTVRQVSVQKLVGLFISFHFFFNRSKRQQRLPKRQQKQ